MRFLNSRVTYHVSSRSFVSPKVWKPLVVFARSFQAPAGVDSFEGPGTGHRHFPEDLGQQFDQSYNQASTFECKTTQQCYEEFPFMVHTSVPLSIVDEEPAGVSVMHATDAGPATGHRRRPPVVDMDALKHPPYLPHPAAPKDLKKELQLRHFPEYMLKGR